VLLLWVSAKHSGKRSWLDWLGGECWPLGQWFPWEVWRRVSLYGMENDLITSLLWNCHMHDGTTWIVGFPVPLTCGWYISCSCHSFSWLSTDVLVSWFQDFKSWALFLSLFESLAVMVVCDLARWSNGLLRTCAFFWLLATYWIAGSL